MAKRKTIEVQKLLEICNKLLKDTVAAPDFRSGVMVVMEHMLHETGNYKGFRYLVLTEVPLGERPGIRQDHYGEILPYPERFEDTDSTRVQYF